jgi:NAD(P) transhydrogenase subunit alpha
VRIVVPAEILPGERRVAMLPDIVPLYTGAGLQVMVQSRAGEHALAPDEAYSAAGAEVVNGVKAASVDVLLHVRPLRPALVGKLKPGAITVGFCSPSSELDTVRAMRTGRITSFAMDLVPRIRRAQSMDALASQGLVAGYRCVLEAALRLPRFFPLFMTMAGTVPPAKVLVLGAGVAGLQATATAKRLGAVVSACDVRAESADEVRSVGGTFLDLGTAEDVAGQRDLLAPHVADCDVLITTAAVPGRPAPRLVTGSMVRAMKPGSVIVDLAAETGGNVEGSRPGEDREIRVTGGVVRLLGLKDAAGALPVDASRLYARNVANLVLLMTSGGEVVPDFDDEVVAAACLTHDGVVRHGPTASLLGELLGERSR